MTVTSVRAALQSLLTRPAVLGILGITMLFLVPRLAGLGQVLTVDEPLWRARAHGFIEAVATGNFLKTSSTGQPGVTTMWIAGLAIPWNTLAASQAAIAIAVTIVSLLNLVLLRRLAGSAVALTAGVLMALDPFFIAHSRVVHTDALLASFMLLTMLCLFLAWTTRQTRYVVYAGITAALTGLTKLFGLFVLLPTALVLALAPRALAADTPGISARLESRYLRRFAFFGVAFILTLLLLWPVLLVSPRTPFAFMTQRVSLHSQKAAIGSGGGDTWYYPREFVRRLSPVVTVLLPVAVLGVVLGRTKSAGVFPARHTIAALVSISLAFAALLSVSEQKSDRYILIAHLTADIAAGAALVWIADIFARNTPQWRALFLAFAAVAGTLMALDVIRLHPYAMAHWNRLLPIPADAKLGWGEGLDEAAAYLRSLGLSSAELTTASYYPRVLAHFLPGVRVERFTQYQSPDFRFVVLYRSMYGRDLGSYETAALQQFLGTDPKEGMIREVDGDSFRLEKIIVVDRLPFVWVFRRLPETSQET